jgi:hypothetical protein
LSSKPLSREAADVKFSDAGPWHTLGAATRGPAYENLQGWKPRVGRALAAPPRAYGDLRAVGGDCPTVGMIMNGDSEAFDSARGLSLSTIGSLLSEWSCSQEA